MAALQVVLETSKGDIVLMLAPEEAPVTVNNFLDYVESGFYNGLVFHRVINDFMIQGGGFTPDMNQRATRAPIKNESLLHQRLENSRGSIAMARTQIADSATSQFFINLKDNEFLNGMPYKAGYAVFGHVVKGMDVVDSIARVKTGYRGPHGDVPVDPVIINKAYVVKEGGNSAEIEPEAS
nr:peptidylprolyl isomerase [Endozoicomonas sp. SESOKO1]